MRTDIGLFPPPGSDRSARLVDEIGKSTTIEDVVGFAARLHPNHPTSKREAAGVLDMPVGEHTSRVSLLRPQLVSFLEILIPCLSVVCLSTAAIYIY